MLVPVLAEAAAVPARQARMLISRMGMATVGMGGREHSLTSLAVLPTMLAVAAVLMERASTLETHTDMVAQAVPVVAGMARTSPMIRRGTV
jgi:hypothetical protein